MTFVQNTPKDQQEMLRRIGVADFSDLITNIPKELLFKGALNLPGPLSEMDVLRELKNLAAQNQNCEDHLCFLGGGAYDHYVPAVVKHITSRSEFYTAYTPYQPEVAQGTLQAIYEYQTMICELTGMDVANASMYDAGSALAEAVLLACSHVNRQQVLMSEAVNPNYRSIVQTYARGKEFDIKTIACVDGATHLAELAAAINNQTAAVIVQHPNFFGYLEEMAQIAEITHKHGALLITANDPISLALLEPPASYGTDIVIGEGQSLGNAMNFGGPYLGIFAAKKDLIRKMPGRIVGQTIDTQGRRGFVLTLQTREQHIRRDKATSNICTNQGLVMLAATVYMALMGKNGMKKVAELTVQKSHYLANNIKKLKGFRLKFDRPFFKEFVVESDLPAKQVIDHMLSKKIFAGIALDAYYPNHQNSFLTAVTEKRTKAELDYFLSSLAELF